MKRNHVLWQVNGLVMALFFLAGCNTPVASFQTPTTIPPSLTYTLIPPTDAPLLPTETATSIPIPTHTFTPTSTPFPSVSVLENVKLRTGPGIIYPIATIAEQGQLLSVLSRNQSGSWLEVIPPGQASAWVPIDRVDRSQLVLSSIEPVSSIPKPPAIPVKWKGEPVDKICLEIQSAFQGSYAEENPGIQTDLARTRTRVQQILSNLGIQTVEPDDPSCQAQLNIAIQIDMHRANYRFESGEVKLCYTGVVVDGNFILEGSDVKLVTSSSDRRTTEDTITGCPSESDYSQEEIRVILKGLSEFWGDMAVAAANDTEDKDMVYVSSLEMDEWGTQNTTIVPYLIYSLSHPEFKTRVWSGYLEWIAGESIKENLFLLRRWAVPQWLKLLSNEDERARQSTAYDLYLMTGQDLGVNESDWQDWMEAYLSPPVIVDSFDQDTNLWPVVTEPESTPDYIISSRISDGKYVWDVKAENHFVYPVALNQKFEGTNFYLSGDVRQLSGSENVFLGLVFRMVDPDQYIFFGIDNRTYERLSLKYKGEWTQLWGVEDFFAPVEIDGPASNYKIAVFAEGNYYRIYVDNVLIYKFLEDRLDDEGIIFCGFGFEFIYAGDKAEFEFDNFELYVVP